MEVVGINYLLEAGVHFGHQSKRWNPKMQEYIFAVRDDLHIIDLQRTVKEIEKAYDVIKNVVSEGGKVIFVGTKKQAQDVVKEEAMRGEMFYVTERWLGGTLTNFQTIRKRVFYLEELERKEREGYFELLPKKEAIKLRKEKEKLERYLSGIKEMDKIPQLMIVVDTIKEENAIREARKLKIPIIGIVDTNCDPDLVDYVIPGNDDAVRAIKVILGVLTNAVVEVNGGVIIDYIGNNETAIVSKKESNKKTIEEKPVVKEEIKVESEIEKKEVIQTKVEDKKEDLSSKTVTELKALAKDKGVTGYSKLKKAELIEVLK